MEYLSKKEMYTGKRFSVEQVVYQDQNGKRVTRDHVVGPDAVAILPVTKDGKIVFVKEVRTAVGQDISFDLPAGKVEKGENPELTALRELQEETGYQAKKLTFLCSYYASKGYTSEKVYLYLAEELEEKGKQNLDEDEKIDVEEISYEKVYQMLWQKKLDSSPLYISLLMYAQQRDR